MNKIKYKVKKKHLYNPPSNFSLVLQALFYCDCQTNVMMSEKPYTAYELLVK